MRQDAYELHTLLKAARIKDSYVLVGHSIGGLIARVYAAQYPDEVVGIVLVDSTHEDTTLMYQGKIVRVREGAKGIAVPPVQTMQSSPPKSPTPEDTEQFEFNQKMFGAPKTEPPFDNLPVSTQAMRLWFLGQPPRDAAGPDFWSEELQAMYIARAKTPYQLGDRPLVVLLGKSGGGNPPPGISADQWRRLSDEKMQQKIGLANLSRNSKLIVAERSGHHIQLDEPHAVTDAIRLVVDAVRHRTRLAP
jgi:pimeloyl-ACP methyl ester carboxylesterase